MTEEQIVRDWLISYWKLTPEQAKASSYEGALRETIKMLLVFHSQFSVVTADRAQTLMELDQLGIGFGGGE